MEKLPKVSICPTAFIRVQASLGTMNLVQIPLKIFIDVRFSLLNPPLPFFNVMSFLRIIILNFLYYCRALLFAAFSCFCPIFFLWPSPFGLIRLEFLFSKGKILERVAFIRQTKVLQWKVLLGRVSTFSLIKSRKKRTPIMHTHTHRDTHIHTGTL